MAILVVICVVGLVLWLTLISLALAFWKKVGEIERGTREALMNIQIQMAFISGRIGLRKHDLDRAVRHPEEPAPPPTEVVGSLGDWTDLDEELAEMDTEAEKGGA